MKTNQVNKVVVDKTLLLRRVIIISWITLAICFVVKIFGGNFFEIICNNPNYIALCEYADTHYWLKLAIGFLSSMLCQSLYELAILQKYKFSKKELIITIISVAFACVVKMYSQTIGLFFDLWLLVLLPIFLLGKEHKRYWNALLGLAFNFAFQLLSVLVKNIGIVNVGETYFIGLIYMIDLYIMLFLYYMYRNFNKKEIK